MAYDGPDKMALMYYITIGFVVFWLIVGLILAFYVRSQTTDLTMKSPQCW